MANFAGPIEQQNLISPSTAQGPAQQFQFRYPTNVAQPPFEKWILFEVRTGRHVLRNQLVFEKGTFLDRTLAAVGLYLPDNALVDSLTMAYDESAIGTLPGAALELFAKTGQNFMDGGAKNNTDTSGSALSDVAGAIFGDRGKATSTAGKVVEAIKGQIWDFLKMETATVVGEALGGGKSAGASLFGVRPNPRTDLLFDTQQYRSHTLTFMLVPRNLAEAVAIDHIIHCFQYYMLPAYLNQETSQIGSMMVGFPYEFVITMMQHNHVMTHVNRIGRSVLKSVSINHAAGNQIAFIEDVNHELYPVMTSLTLEFQEVKLLGRDSEEINRGPDNVQTTLDDPRLR